MDSQSHESPPAVSRDWFFPAPSPSFIHHSSAFHRHKPPARRFSTYSKPTNSSSSSLLSPSSNSASVQISNSRDLKYAGFRRRTNFSRQYQRSPAPEVADSSLANQVDQKCDVSGDKITNSDKFSGQRLKFRWQMAFFVAVGYLCDYV